jgi:hypothetical protein
MWAISRLSRQNVSIAAGGDVQLAVTSSLPFGFETDDGNVATSICARTDLAWFVSVAHDGWMLIYRPRVLDIAVRRGS